jgi:transcriptional regulator with XRE-family HTH domain
MDASIRQEMRDFLTSRRARITPEQAGLRTFGNSARRVPGLRREEVASLAGVSVDYYNRLERGNAAGVSDTVLDALARALMLDDAERAHLFDLARGGQASAPRKRRRSQRQGIRPAVQQMLDAMSGVAAFVRNARLDIVGANQLFRALYSDHFDDPTQPQNMARFLFLDPRATSFFVEWDQVANDVVALLRTEAGRDPHDRDLTDLVGELSMRSEPFRKLWATHNIRAHDPGAKRFYHPLVGELTLTFETLELVGDPGLTLTVYTPEPGTKSAEALNLLGSWTTPDPADGRVRQEHHRGTRGN